MKDLQSWGSESQKFGLIWVDEGQMNTKKNTKLRFQVSTLHQSELRMANSCESEILLLWWFGPLQLICCKSATFVNETRPRAHKGGVISSQQGFRLQLYLTCISIRAEEGLTLETSVSLCFCSDYLTLISLFNNKFSWIDHFTVPWVVPGLWMKVRLEASLFW